MNFCYRRHRLHRVRDPARYGGDGHGGDWWRACILLDREELEEKILMTAFSYSLTRGFNRQDRQNVDGDGRL